MANTDTLSTLFTNIANAIRSKTGSTAKITPANMASAINGITVGSSGGTSSVSSITIEPSSNAQSISISGLKGQPTTFTLIATTQWTSNSTNKGVIAVTYNGTTHYGVHNNSSGSYMATNTIVPERTELSSSYSNGTLTISTTASNINFLSAVTYRLIYTYD